MGLKPIAFVVLLIVFFLRYLGWLAPKPKPNIKPDLKQKKPEK